LSSCELGVLVRDGKVPSIPMATFLNVFGEDRPASATARHRLIENEQQVQHQLNLLKAGSIPLQDKHREEQVGLAGVDFFGKPLAILEAHALDTQHRVDEIAT
jgi:hypothetical protein